MGGATVRVLHLAGVQQISTHAPRGRRDCSAFYSSSVCGEFQPTRLVGGATTGTAGLPLRHGHFNPRASWEARPIMRNVAVAVSVFQPTRLVGGATIRQRLAQHVNVISTHAPRGRRDPRTGSRGGRRCRFQPTRLVGGATRFKLTTRSVTSVSTHAPRGRRDPLANKRVHFSLSVSTHAPRGRRDPSTASGKRIIRSFNPRASWEARPTKGAMRG